MDKTFDIYLICFICFEGTHISEKTQKTPQTGTETHLRNNFYFSPPSVQISVHNFQHLKKTNKKGFGRGNNTLWQPYWRPRLCKQLIVFTKLQFLKIICRNEKCEVRKTERGTAHLFQSGWSCLMFPVVLQHCHLTVPPLPLPPLSLIKQLLSKREKQEKNNLKISSQRGSRRILRGNQLK